MSPGSIPRGLFAEGSRASPRRVAVYARVSTTRQETAAQIREVDAWILRAGDLKVATYREREHGWEPDRAVLAELYAAAHRREFDAVAVWALDRFSRQGIEATFALIRRLRECGVELLSLREPFLSTGDPRVSEIVLALFAWVARQEHLRISDRTKAGLAVARANGKQIGVPRKWAFSDDEARRLRASGLGWKAIATALHVPRGAIGAIRRACAKEGGVRKGPPERPSKTGARKGGVS